MHHEDGHFFLLPVCGLHNDTPLRGTDPLTCVGVGSCNATIDSLAALARALNAFP